MPPKDSCHDQVAHALEKDGWRIHPNQPRFKADIIVIIDIEAYKDDATAYIEVKCFPGANSTQEIHVAFGQYILYRQLLAKAKPNATLYLAVPEDVFRTQFTETIQDTIRSNDVKIIVVDMIEEVITQWIA